MRILVYDDDSMAVQHLLELLQQFFSNHKLAYHVHVCQNKEELFSTIQDYDFLFLDIEVYDDNGIDLGLEVRRRHPNIHILITSSFTKYLVSGYKVKADRYFLKPIQSFDFDVEFGAVVKQFQQEHAYLLDDKFFRQKIYIKDIMYVEFLDRKTYVHIHKEQTIMTSYPLNYWMEQLQQASFVQTYKSFLVNVAYVKTYDEQCLTLINKETLPLSRHYKKGFQKAYMYYLQGGL